MSARKLILIADDDQSDRYFLRQALLEECKTADVREVQDGQEAVDYLRGAGRYADRKAYPLPTHVLIDVKMPRRSGLEVVRWMRSSGEAGQIPVTVLSGSQLDGDRDEAHRLGAEYLVKPVEYAALQDLIRSKCSQFGLGS